VIPLIRLGYRWGEGFNWREYSQLLAMGMPKQQLKSEGNIAGMIAAELAAIVKEHYMPSHPPPFIMTNLSIQATKNSRINAQTGLSYGGFS